MALTPAFEKLWTCFTDLFNCFFFFFALSFKVADLVRHSGLKSHEIALKNAGSLFFLLMLLLLSFLSEHWQCLLSSPLCLLNSLVSSSFWQGSERERLFMGRVFCPDSPGDRQQNSVSQSVHFLKTSIHLLPFIPSPSQHVGLNASRASLQCASREPDSLSSSSSVMDGRRYEMADSRT